MNEGGEGEAPTQKSDSGYYRQEDGKTILRKITPEELESPNPKPVETKEGFKIRGVNETALVKSLKTLGGVTIYQLEAEMRPGEISHGGFLGRGERLLDILAEDNDAVLGMGLTHQQLADFLFYFADAQAFADKHPEALPQAYEYSGRTYTYSEMAFRGIQKSPFRDGSLTNKEMTVTNLKDGSKISFSGLLPIMINRYGFYEGKGAPQRLDPKKLAEFAGLVKPPSPKPASGGDL